MSETTDLDLLLIGKTGNGKSATGNSILMHESFKHVSSANSVTSELQEGFGKCGDLKIKVVDSPGVGDTRMDSQKATIMVTKALKKAIMINPRGYHAFLILLKYGGRYTGEEQDAIKYLKGVFGLNFVREFCILVMSYGDSFKTDPYIRDDMTFEKWCAIQEGPLKELMAECGNRIVLFDNRTKDPREKKAQLERLIYLVNNLKSRGKRYTHELFQEAKETRNKILEDAKDTIIQESILVEATFIFQEFEQIQNSVECIDVKLKSEKLKEKSQNICHQIRAGKSPAFAMLLQSLNSLNRIIDFQIHFHEKVSQENVRHTAEMVNRHKGDMVNMCSEFSKVLTEVNNEEEGNQKPSNVQAKDIQKDLEHIKEIGNVVERRTAFEMFQKRPEEIVAEEPNTVWYDQSSCRPPVKPRKKIKPVKAMVNSYEQQRSHTEEGKLDGKNSKDRKPIEERQQATSRSPTEDRETVTVTSTKEKCFEQTEKTLNITHDTEMNMLIFASVKSDTRTVDKQLEKQKMVGKVNRSNGNKQNLGADVDADFSSTSSPTPKSFATQEAHTKKNTSKENMSAPRRETDRGENLNPSDIRSKLYINTHNVTNNSLIVIATQVQEKTDRQTPEMKRTMEQMERILEETKQAQELLRNAINQNTESFLSRAWAWLTKPIRAVANWVASQF
ncbi:uncharacterized protein LOC106068839 [Biomphalaria glabrata]|uniref:Uncharacterized protein LOC106068839 n=1 Tax=Biomphalaria glabrata TaxID=6526 RepID=A0A9W2YPB0_BIOGL|nr:uncharacterized protein LOC106068839 [Biomphalaria glabrata]XP_055864511.1 uncharacterized protein LOC106068839 [Biomphalaria glabrata]